jgi:hypothetical protein
MADDVVELDLGVRPEAAVSGVVCLQTALATFLTFNAMRVRDHGGSHGEGCMEEVCTAVVSFKRCLAGSGERALRRGFRADSAAGLWRGGGIERRVDGPGGTVCGSSGGRRRGLVSLVLE